MFDDFLGGLAGLFGGGDSGQASPAAGMTQPAQGGGGIMEQFLPLLIGGGASLASTLMNRGNNKAISKAEKQIGEAGGIGSAAGKQMVERASKGQLTDAQQATVERMKAEQNAKWNQYLSNLGIPVSSTQVQAANLVDTQATELANKLINETFGQGLEALKLGTEASKAQLQAALASRADMSKTIWNVAEEIGRVLNTKGDVPNSPVVATQVPGEWGSGQEFMEAGSWGTGDEFPAQQGYYA